MIFGMSSVSPNRFFIVLVALVLGLSACGREERELTPRETGSECPPQGEEQPSPEAGRKFIQDHCIRCHNAQNPDRQSLETIEAIREWAEVIDRVAAAGPLRVNTYMPPDDPVPTVAERRHLGQWLACGAP
jgi:hypothetical protein